MKKMILALHIRTLIFSSFIFVSLFSVLSPNAEANIKPAKRAEGTSKKNSAVHLNLAADKPFPKSEKKLQQDGSILYVSTTAFLTSQDFSAATLPAQCTPENCVLSLTLKKESAARLFSVTSQNVGKRLAIFGAGKLSNAPTIQEGIAGPDLQLSGNFSKSELEKIVEEINSKKDSTSK